MKGKGIWILVIILAAVLLFLLFKGTSNSNRAAGSIDGGVAPSSNIPSMLEALQDTTGMGPSPRDCKKDCKSLCDVHPIKILCKDRCKCIKACESDCVKGADYKNMYP